MITKKSLKERLEDKFVKGTDDECWLWKAGKTAAGYGVLRYGGKSHYAHRLSYQLYVGEIPAGMFICHVCDTPECINPAHLFIGTQKDNMHDCVVKNRMVVGEKHWNSKLTAEDVIAIRASTEKQKVLALKYGVIQQAISLIKTDKRWKHIEGAE